MKNTNKTKKKAKKNLMISGYRRLAIGTALKILLPGTGIGSFVTARGASMIMTDLVVNKLDHAIWTATTAELFNKMPELAHDVSKKYEGIDEFIDDYCDGGYNTEGN